MAIAFAMVGVAFMPLTGRPADRPMPPAGIAWKVQGEWTTQKANHPLQTGDPVSPGSLLQPAGLDKAHSLTVLLPDGQQLLYECFTPEDCARGFRVPALVDRPSPFALEMMARMRRVLGTSGPAPSTTPILPPQTRRTMPALDETVVVRADSRAVPVGGLLAALPNGRYSYVLRRVSQAASPQDVLILQKSDSTCTVPFPGPGLYDMLVSDPQSVQRVDMFVAVLDPGQKGVLRNYSEAKALLDGWNEKFTGWPEHELLRAYLQSFSIDSK